MNANERAGQGGRNLVQQLQRLRRMRGHYNFIKRFNPTLCRNQNFLTVTADAGDGTAQARIGQAAHDCIDVLPTAADDAVPGSDVSEMRRLRRGGEGPLRTAEDEEKAVIVQEADHGRDGELRLRQRGVGRGSSAGRPQAFGCRGSSRRSPAWAAGTCVSVSRSAAAQLPASCSIKPVMREHHTNQFLNAAPKACLCRNCFSVCCISGAEASPRARRLQMRLKRRMPNSMDQNAGRSKFKG